MKKTAPEVAVGSTVEVKLKTVPGSANSAITYTSGTEANATVAAKLLIQNKVVNYWCKSWNSVITATSGDVTTTLTVTVK